MCLIFIVNKILTFHICVAKERIPHRMVWPEQHGQVLRLCLYSTLFFVVLIQLVNISLAVTFFFQNIKTILLDQSDMANAVTIRGSQNKGRAQIALQK